MTDSGSECHTRGHGATSPGGPGGHKGAPGGSRLPPAPKPENNGPKPWFNVPKVCPEPEPWEMVLIHFWGICGHLIAFNHGYLVKTPIWGKKWMGSAPQMESNQSWQKNQTRRFWVVPLWGPQTEGRNPFYPGIFFASAVKKNSTTCL